MKYTFVNGITDFGVGTTLAWGKKKKKIKRFGKRGTLKNVESRASAIIVS